MSSTDLGLGGTTSLLKTLTELIQLGLQLSTLLLNLGKGKTTDGGETGDSTGQCGARKHQSHLGSGSSLSFQFLLKLLNAGLK